MDTTCSIQREEFFYRYTNLRCPNTKSRPIHYDAPANWVSVSHLATFLSTNSMCTTKKESFSLIVAPRATVTIRRTCVNRDRLWHGNGAACTRFVTRETVTKSEAGAGGQTNFFGDNDDDVPRANHLGNTLFLSQYEPHPFASTSLHYTPLHTHPPPHPHRTHGCSR